MTKRKFTWKAFKKQKVLMIWSVIFLIYGLIFYYGPFIEWLMAFKKYKPKRSIFKLAFIGLKSLKELLAYDQFWYSLRNTLVMEGGSLIFTTIIAILFAIVLSELHHEKVKKTILTISFLPYFLSWIVASVIWNNFASCMSNIELLWPTIGLKNILVYGSAKTFWPFVWFVNVWKNAGWHAIIYLAAITAINPTFYEAAVIDGAGKWEKIKYIILPGIKATIMIMLLFDIGDICYGEFALQYVVRLPYIQEFAKTMDIFIVNYGIAQGAYSTATGACMIQSIIRAILIIILNFILNRWGEEHLF